MDVWPPLPTSEKPEPSTGLIEAGKKASLGYVALGFSAVAILIRALVFLKIHSNWSGWLSFAFVGMGLALGIRSRSTLAGRLALLGPLLFFGEVVYSMLRWYGA
jgi:hypothetical protein